MITRARAYQLRALMEKGAKSLSDEDALQAVELFPAWAAGASYQAGIRIRYEGQLYRCEQAHTAQADWTPDATPALWTAVAEPGEIPVWKQPSGAQDAYMTGDKVWYPERDTKVYVSLVDNNVWAPDAYPAGWEEVV